MQDELDNEKIKPKRITQKSRPNWKDSDEYSYLKAADEEQFAWEFLRRNQCYQNNYKKYKNYQSSKELGLNEESRRDKEFLKLYFKCDPPSKKHESYDDYMQRMINEGYSLTNGEVRVVSKRVSFYRKYDLKPHINMKRYSPRNLTGPGFSFLNNKYPMFVEHNDMGLPSELKETFSDQMVVKLCILLPIEEQLDAIKQEIQNRAKALGKTSFKERGISDSARLNYICCLILLDAIKQGVEDENERLFYIYKHLFPYPNSIKNKEQLIAAYSALDPAGRKTITKRMKDDIHLADDLCNKGGYISIVKSRSHYINQSQRASKHRIEKEI
jgi:hypothetical protein